ncbi:MAG: nucleotide exchange factor GrpE, partial [Proteobacteria bacterium]|nr:nucleotide exchange factor GrpE [Pseudomonadota bacterium]
AGEAAEASVAEAAAPADEVAELKDRLLRAMAETENVRRRAARDREDASKYAVTGFARDILPVIDNLRRALDSVPEEARNEAPIASLVAGVEMTERELLGAFERHGIRRIDPMGERFDHNLHQAVFEVDDPQTPPGTIVEVVQPGYVIADRLLRPAMVGVAKGADAPPAVDTEA